MIQWTKHLNLEQEILKSCATFTDYITEITNMQVDDAQKVDIVMHMCNLTEYCGPHLNTSGGWWQYKL